MPLKHNPEDIENGEIGTGYTATTTQSESVSLLYVQETEYGTCSRTNPKKSKSTKKFFSKASERRQLLTGSKRNWQRMASNDSRSPKTPTSTKDEKSPYSSPEDGQSPGPSQKGEKSPYSSPEDGKSQFSSPEDRKSQCPSPKDDDMDMSIKLKAKLSSSSPAFEEEQMGITRFLGIFLAVAAAIQFSLSALVIKILGYHPFNLGVWRFGVMAVIPIPILIYSIIKNRHDKSLSETLWPECSIKSGLLIILQAIVGANSIIFTFFGLKYLNMADCIVIGTSAPVFVTLCAFMFLGEKCGLIPIVTALLALAGVSIISKPPLLTGAESLDKEMMIGVASSFSSMILLTICYIALRYLRKVHHALVNLCFGLWGFSQSLVVAVAMGKLEVPKTYYEAGYIVLSAVLAFSAQTCLTLALKYEQAGPVALVRTTEVLFAFGWQALFLGVQPDIYSAIGALVTLSGVVLTSFRKMIMSLPEDDKHRKRFRFLLL